MITLRTSAGDKAIAAMTLRTPSGDKGIARATLRTPTGDEVIFDATSSESLPASSSPINAVGAETSDADTNVETNFVTVTVTGGTEPYLYLWTQISGTPSDWSINSTNSRTTSFTGLDVPGGGSFEAIFRCSVSDARGRTGSVDVNARAINYGDVY